MKNRGVFTIGRRAEEAVKAAVMVEDVAQTVFHALQLGRPAQIPQRRLPGPIGATCSNTASDCQD